MNQMTGGRVALRCDAGGAIGVGHAMRCVALGEELTDRGHEVLLWGDLGGLGWLEELVSGHGYDVVPAPSTLRESAHAAEVLDLQAVVIDGYHLDPGMGRALAADSRRILTIVDYEFGVHQYAHVYVDQNLGAVPHPDLPTDAIALAGIDYALLRDSLRRHRRVELPVASDPLSVVAVFGGTDAFGAAPAVLPALLAADVPLDVTVVASGPEASAALRAVPTGPRQRVNVVPATADFGALVADADLVISASGSSVWELLCLGVPAAVLCVVDNQQEGYRLMLEHDVVTGLGTLDDFDPARVAARLQGLLTDPETRASRARRGQALVDGLGRARVAEAFLP